MSCIVVKKLLGYELCVLEKEIRRKIIYEFIDENGFTAYLPTNTLFLVGVAVLLMTLIPLCLADREHKANNPTE